MDGGGFFPYTGPGAGDFRGSMPPSQGGVKGDNHACGDG